MKTFSALKFGDGKSCKNNISETLRAKCKSYGENACFLKRISYQMMPFGGLERRC